VSAYPAYTFGAWLPEGLKSIHDGDTLHAGIDLGMDIVVNTTIRFYGCNVPELPPPQEKQASRGPAGCFPLWQTKASSCR
jgi:hypothetical protein